MAKSAEELLIFIFDEILPKHGMNLRVKQKELSLEMLRALQENKLALCEAEVGERVIIVIPHESAVNTRASAA